MNDWVLNTTSEVMNSDGQIANINKAIEVSLSGIEKIDSVLSVGSGDGTEIALFESVGLKVKGIDGNFLSVDKCKSKGFDVVQGDMHEMPFKDKEFDMVFSRDVFEHAFSHIALIQEMARVSKKYVSITLPDESWGSSGLHSLIPTTEQMIYLGMKADLSLRTMGKFFINNVFQTTYLFTKNNV